MRFKIFSPTLETQFLITMLYIKEKKTFRKSIYSIKIIDSWGALEEERN